MMEEWWKTTLLLCLYGFFKEIRPSEPFLTEYLLGNSTGITSDQLYQDVYPIWTYSYLAVLVLVFLFTDFLKYKAVIVFEGIAYIVTWILLLWGKGVLAMQMMQVAYGIATSTEVAYFTYIYAKVSGHYYQQVTSFTRTALLIGRFLSGLLSQVLIGTGAADYRALNYISLAMVSVAALLSIFLPPVTTSVYFHRNLDDGDVGLVNTDTVKKPFMKSIKSSLSLVYRDFIKSFSNFYILKWSFWWALGMCGNFQVGNYIQPLWEEVMTSTNSSSEELLNGGVEAATTLTGAALAFVLGFLHLNWSLIGEITVAVISILDAVVLYMMAEATSIWTAYIGYLVFRALYQMMITVASFEIARNISQDSYGLVFGFNTFLALAFQSILTATVADSVGLALPPREQFLVYAGYFAVVGGIYALVGTLGCVNNFSRFSSEGVWLGPDRRDSSSSRIDPPVGSVECPQ